MATVRNLGITATILTKHSCIVISPLQMKYVVVVVVVVIVVIYFFNLSQQPPVGQGLLIHEVSRSHTATHHSR